MNIDRIDFISAYCDRWCERCAFTTRCSTYAIEVAIGMCEGDEEAAMQLAIGAPPPRDAAEQKRREAFIDEMLAAQPTETELAAYAREEEERDERVDSSPVTTAVERFTLLAAEWLEAHPDVVPLTLEPRLAEAIDVAGWDVHLIAAKLHRALRGRDEFLSGSDDADTEPLQNDWNGSAKVALISIRRSTIAWTRITDATNDPDAAAVLSELHRLRPLVERTFPDAWRFVRPGFDTERQPG